MNVRTFTVLIDRRRGPHRITIVRAGRDDNTTVEVCESPSGRSVQVHVNGRKVHPPLTDPVDTP